MARHAESRRPDRFGRRARSVRGGEGSAVAEASDVVLLCLAALLAGWVDAASGGGGLVQLPALLVLLPTAAPEQVLATNKLSSICGTSVATATYYRRVRPDLRTALPMAAAAVAGSAAGAAC